MIIRTTLGTTLAQALLDDIKTGTAGNAKMQLYTGTRPSALGGAITDDLLAEFNLGATVGSVTNGVLTLSGWSNEDAAPNGGAPGWARILDEDGNEVIYLTASASGGGGQVIVNASSIVLGSPVDLTSAAIRMPV